MTDNWKLLTSDAEGMVLTAPSELANMYVPWRSVSSLVLVTPRDPASTHAVLKVHWVNDRSMMTVTIADPQAASDACAEFMGYGA